MEVLVENNSYLSIAMVKTYGNIHGASTHATTQIGQVFVTRFVCLLMYSKVGNIKEKKKGPEA